MKRTYLTILALGAAFTAAAQARFTSNTETVNLGQIEWKHPAMAQYTVTNTGNEPLLLTDVEPDCACTTTHWTMTPIAPGAKGIIQVTFDAKALGTFHKSVAITCNTHPSPVRLYLTGEVVEQITDFTQTHPYVIGNIRFNRNEINFPDINKGEHPQFKIEVVNQSETPYEPVLMHLPSYLSMEVEPKVLLKGERGVITLTLKSDKLTDLGLTQSSVYLARFSGDKVSEDNELPVSAILLPDFSLMSEQEKLNGPVMSISETELDMSADLARKKKAKRDLTVTNRGKSPLQISKLQVFHPAVGVSLKKNILLPGESTRLRVEVTKKNIAIKRRHLRLLMITNDPLQPKVEINIKAK